MISKHDKQLIKTSRKYNISPSTMKCEAFALFDQGYSLEEVRYLLRRYRDPYYPNRFVNTLRKYHEFWEEAQSNK
jgi:hypothetical protein